MICCLTGILSRSILTLYTTSLLNRASALLKKDAGYREEKIQDMFENDSTVMDQDLLVPDDLADTPEKISPSTAHCKLKGLYIRLNQRETN